MKLLLVKTSSLGDVFHTLPALEDAWRSIPGLEVDWVVEEAFADIPNWHPAVNRVIPVAWRRWRKRLLGQSERAEMAAFRKQLASTRYDLVLDAQGLLKSAAMAWLADGPRVGLDKHSAREPLASRFYQRCYGVDRQQHAIERLRQLFADALGYDYARLSFSYGVSRARWSRPQHQSQPYWLFLHGTTWETKLWPEAYWQQLALQASESGREVVLPWGNDEERERAERIASHCGAAKVLPRLGLDELTAWLAHAEAIVGVDTGLSHVAAALEVPAVAIYGATDASLTGALGPAMKVLKSQYHCAPCLSRRCLHPDEQGVQPPCYREVTPADIRNQLDVLIGAAHDSA